MEAQDSNELSDSFERSLASILAQRSGSSIAVLVVSLDHFKTLSDSLGHAVADQVFELAGQRLRSILRKSDTLSRLPDHEFAIVLNPIVSELDAKATADRLTDLLQRAYLVQGQVVNTSGNIGIKLAVHSATDSATLVKRAGMALQCARSSGPGAVEVFEIAMEDRIIALHALTLDLRKALLLHQLEVHYQPQVDIGIQHLTGFEALLRWRHPDLGWVSPAYFVPIAEEIGLIDMIGDWVLRTACQQASRLPARIVVAVNASPLQIRTGSFASSVERALSEASITADQLEIEITEGALMQESRAVLSTLNDLHSMGVRLAMDDFGTGYSSLGQLAKFPFDTIKIDRSLVMDRPTLAEGAKQRAIVRAISTLGKGLGMCTLVEGIETELQLTNAYSDGCISAQGYLFGKAAPASQLDKILAAFSRRLKTPFNMRIHTDLPERKYDPQYLSDTVLQP